MLYIWIYTFVFSFQVYFLTSVQKQQESLTEYDTCLVQQQGLLAPPLQSQYPNHLRRSAQGSMQSRRGYQLSPVVHCNVQQCRTGFLRIPHLRHIASAVQGLDTVGDTLDGIGAHLGQQYRVLFERQWGFRQEAIA